MELLKPAAAVSSPHRSQLHFNIDTSPRAQHRPRAETTSDLPKVNSGVLSSVNHLAEPSLVEDLKLLPSCVCAVFYFDFSLKLVFTALQTRRSDRVEKINCGHNILQI